MKTNEFQLPWSVAGTGTFPDILDYDDNIVAETVPRDMAEFIVKAANGHAELLIAVQCLIANPVISGMAAGIRDSAAQRRVVDPLEYAKKIVAKIV